MASKPSEEKEFSRILECGLCHFLFQAFYQLVVHQRDVPDAKGDAKVLIVERFNPTFKGCMYRYFTTQGTQD